MLRTLYSATHNRAELKSSESQINYAGTSLEYFPAFLFLFHGKTKRLIYILLFLLTLIFEITGKIMVMIFLMGFMEQQFAH